jgi:Leucine-rich repeat (LRR) protein
MQQDEGVDFSSLTALNLRSNNLKVLPKELFMLTSTISSTHPRSCHTRDSPCGVTPWTDLTFLDLSKNQLPTLHPALSLLTSLRRLEVLFYALARHSTKHGR